jgi:hypothetical protein
MGLGLRVAASTALLLVGACAATPVVPFPSAEPSESVSPPAVQTVEPIARDCPADEIRVACWAALSVMATPRDAPHGQLLSLDPFDGHPIEPYPVGTRVFVHEAAQGADWWKVQVPPFESRYGGDLFGWFGAQELAPAETPPCPALITREALAELEQPDRLACLGSREIQLEGAVWETRQWPTFGVGPDWFGEPESGRVFGLYPNVTLGLGLAGRELPVGVPDGVDPLPKGIHVRVTGSFDHPDAVECVRRPEQGEPIEEDPADSVTWCRQRFVVSAWQAIGGAEGRPYDGTLQLHRLRPVQGEIGCDTIGIPYRSFMIRIDPGALVQVWAQADAGHDLFIFWEPTVTGGDESDPVVRGPNGEVVARDGDVIRVGDQLGALGGYAYCAGPDAISVYDQRPAPEDRA